jgi:ADP-ribosylglycohydrolase/pimeloyl-ACP methyl ester carboxylesterase
VKKFLQAALVSDALSLGSHWIYNQGKLARLYPAGVHQFTDPESNYHPNRKAGQLTHYGDQTNWLASSIKRNGGFDIENWKQDWLTENEQFDGFLDGASKETLANAADAPSNSNDLAGASRIAPLLDTDLSLDELVAAARAQTELTHGDPTVSDAAEFFARATGAIEGGAAFAEAFQIACETSHSKALNYAETLQQVQSLGDDALAVSANIGLTCHLPEAFPLTLYLALRPGATFESAISENALCGGDTSARAMILALLFAARDGEVGASLASGLLGPSLPLKPGINQLRIGHLSGILDMPEGTPIAFAIFAHCFTCGKDFLPGTRVSRGLAQKGIATLRIDFSGLGKSSGEFSESSFLTNVDDLILAAEWLRNHHQAPTLLVGHSLGGAAVLAAASKIEGIKAVATIGAPAEPGHVQELFADAIPEIEKSGEAEVNLAGRPFRIGRKFIDDFKQHKQLEALSQLQGVETLIMHAPTDQTVGLENAGVIYSALRHPKSFISLTGADHLLTRPRDAQYVVDLISTWSSRALA